MRPPTPETLAPAYFLYGGERLMLDRALRAIRAAAHPDGGADLATDTIDAREGGEGAAAKKADLGGSIVNACRTMPFLARRRLVVVRAADALEAEAGEAIVRYLESPSPTTCLVLIGGEKIDGRTRFIQKLKAGGFLHAFDPPKGTAGAEELVRSEAAARGVRLDPDAARALVDAVGPDAGQLADALERLALFVAPETRIGIEAVDQVVLASRRRSIFDLMKIVGKGSLEGALTCVAALDPDDRAPLKIVFMLSRHVRQLAVAKSLAARKADRFEIARVAGVPPFVAGELVEQARGFSAEALEKSFGALAEADRLLKSSRNDEQILLDRLLLQLCALKASRPAPKTVTSSRSRG